MDSQYIVSWMEINIRDMNMTRAWDYAPGKKASEHSLFVCGISVMSGQLINELFPDRTRSCFSQVVLCRMGGDHIYEMRCLFVAVGPNARFIVLPHWDNMLTHPVTLY